MSDENKLKDTTEYKIKVLGEFPENKQQVFRLPTDEKPANPLSLDWVKTHIDKLIESDKDALYQLVYSLLSNTVDRCITQAIENNIFGVRVSENDNGQAIENNTFGVRVSDNDNDNGHSFGKKYKQIQDVKLNESIKMVEGWLTDAVNYHFAFIHELPEQKPEPTPATGTTTLNFVLPDVFVDRMDNRSEVLSRALELFMQNPPTETPSKRRYGLRTPTSVTVPTRLLDGLDKISQQLWPGKTGHRTQLVNMALDRWFKDKG